MIRPSGRADEIGLAEEALARMEGTLAEELRQKRRLAELGLAVSKINHELRNMLTTAQLLTDRLGKVPDGAAQRVTPRLIGTLDRAIAFCEATLAYGRAAERLPVRRLIPLAPLVEELADLTGLAPGAAIAFGAEVPAGLRVDADAEQLSRILVNLVRNAVQALSQAGAPAARRGSRLGTPRATPSSRSAVRDNGPGMPAARPASLFSAFQGSARSGGRASASPSRRSFAASTAAPSHNEDGGPGACFRITIPDRVEPGPA